MSWPATARERHHRAATTFGERVRGVRDWGVETPVAEWRARDVVLHLLDWLPGFLEAGSQVRLDAVPRADDDLATSWATRSAQVQELVETRGDVVHRSQMLGEMTLADAVDRFYTTDVMMHTWDLARGTDQDDRLDPEFCAQAFAGMEPMAEMLASSGQFGTRVPVPDGADVQDRLIGLIGRDPAWRRPR